MPNPELQALKSLDHELAFSGPPSGDARLYDVQLAHLFEMIPAAVILKDIRGQIIRANRRAEELLDLQGIEGKNARQLFRDFERREALDAQVIQTGIPKRGELHEHVRRDGGRVWLLEDRIPHHDETGSIDGVLVFAVDVSSVVGERR